MSGHSKWSTIKRKKGANDAKRGKLNEKSLGNLDVHMIPLTIPRWTGDWPGFDSCYKLSKYFSMELRKNFIAFSLCA